MSVRDTEALPVIIGDALETVFPVSYGLVENAVQMQRSNGVQPLWKNTGGEIENAIEMTKVERPVRVKKIDALAVPKPM